MRGDGGRSWLLNAERVDIAAYAAIAATPTPALDGVMCAVSRAADHSRLWYAAAMLLALARREGGRRAAVTGLASLCFTSVTVNGVLKPLARRQRPDRLVHAVPLARHVPMPVSRSLPSGHAASAFAFAGGVGHVLPLDAFALRSLAAVVAYSRVHTGRPLSG
jgi:membrane-associated phospholipid phosphatase